MQNKEKVERIGELLQDLQSGNDAYDDLSAGYHYDYDSVIQLLEQAKVTMKESVRCPRPKDLPKDIPWSERLSQGADDEDFNPYAFDGTMSPEDYDKMTDNHERDIHSVVVYQSPDGRHCALQRQDNYGIPDETTGAVGKRYVLPRGISIAADCNRYHQLQNDDDPGQEVFIENDKNGVPSVHMVYTNFGESFQDIIPIKEYVEVARSQPDPSPKQEKQYDSLTNKLSSAHQEACLQNQVTYKTSPDISL